MSENLQGLLDFRRSYETPERPSEKSGWVFHNGRVSRKKEAQRSDASGLIHLLSGILPDGYNCSGDLDKSLIKAYHDFWEVLMEHHSNPLSSLVLSKTMLLPHQVQAAVQVVESLQPRVLIADEVGLGKTIETGLIIKELILKYNYNKVLIAVPAPLMFQWKAELGEKFNEEFTIIDGQVLRKNPDILDQENKVIVSIDLLKMPVYWDRFIKKSFDTVIFDEAHRLRKDSFKATRAYQFAEKISSTCRALILLSATPFRGKIEEIYYLIQLIDPDILGPFHSFYADYSETGGGNLRDRLAPVVIRRRKSEVGGFTRRFARTVRFHLDALERSFYDSVTDYVKKEYNRAIKSNQNVKAFVMVIFQKLLDSSSYALLRALEKRKDRLEQMYYRMKQEKKSGLDIFENEDIADIMEEYPEMEDTASDEIFNPEEVRQEIFALTRLIALGKKIEIDMKLKILLRTINSMKKEGHKKIIIFTQFVNTMNYIANHLSASLSVTVFHGGLSARDKENAIAEFFAKTEILICTEAGGEGRNLQAATALINYDLPWSPLKIEQRIGRIHRFGQKSDVYIINFATKDTIAEKILEIIERKIKLFEDAFGESDVLLGTAEDDRSFEKNIANLLREKKTVLEIEEEIEKSTIIAKKNVKKIDTLLTTEVLDFNMSAFSKALKKKEMIKEHEKKLQKIVTGSRIPKEDLFMQNKDLFTFWRGNEMKTGSFNLEISENAGNVDYLTIGHGLIDKVLNRLSSTVEKNIAYCAQSAESGVLVFLQAHIHLDRVYNRFYTVYLDKKNNEVYFDFPPQNGKDMLIEKNISFEEINNDLNTIIAAVQEKILNDVEKIQRKLYFGVNYWKKNLETSHIYKEQELLERLEIQKGKAKWYGEDKMIGAISRTINQQKDEKRRWKERISRLEKNLEKKVDLNIRHLLLYGNFNS
ncbi:MAG: SNF2-related protein [Spirochaetia bacterium]|nr:SNF2-related protein [Spirochaetia bacterium]